MTSQFKGLTWVSRTQSWQAQICHNGKKIHVATIKCDPTPQSRREAERRAAIEYDKKAITLGLPTNILKPLNKKAA